jgi:hypothetical protein
MPGFTGTIKAHEVSRWVPRRGGTRMATYVLVGGACLGGWCWQDVAPHNEALQSRPMEESL